MIVEKKMTDTSNYNSIDLAKIIMAILVVMIHVKPFGNSISNNCIVFLNFGVQNYLARIAVPFFFVSSGFFLFKKTSFDSFNINIVYKYIKHIIYIYFFWSLIYIIPSFVDLLEDGKSLFFAILVYIRNTIFLGSFQHLWYLNALIFSVYLVALLLQRRIKPLYIIVISALFYFAGLFAQSWFGFILPLKEGLPQFWNVLKLIGKIIGTTRNGLFEGFLFVSIGMCFAFYNFKIKKKTALICFFFSMFAMFLEVLVLKKIDYIRAYDMYFFLVPVTFFGFVFLLKQELPNSQKYKVIRECSSLIYYLHLWINIIVTQILKAICIPISESWVRFMITLVVTIIVSIFIIKISELEKWKWLKKIYK